MIPLYTNYLPTHTMGKFDIYTTYSGAIFPVLYLEIWLALLRFLYESGEDNYVKKIFGSLKKAIVWGTIAATVIFGLFSLIFNKEDVIIIYLLVITYSFSYIYQFAARGMQQNIDFAISGIINTVVLSVSNILLITQFSMGIYGLVISNLLGNIAQIIYLEIRLKLIKKIIDSKYSSYVMKDMLNYSIPLTVNSVSYWALNSSNKLIVNNMIGLSANGVYAISQKFSNIVAFVTTAFNYAFQDVAYSRNESGDDSKFFSNSMSYFLLALSVGSFGIIIGTRIVVHIFIGEQYQEAVQIIPFGVLAAAANAFSTFLGNIFGKYKQTKIILYSTLVSSIINIALTIFMIKMMGLMGVSIALIISLIISILIKIVVLYKNHNIKLKLQFFIPSMLLQVISIILYFNI